jgi:hypothetical protein
MSVSTYKKTKAVLALIAVAALSVIFAFSAVSELGLTRFLYIYLGGAVFGLAASIATILIVRKKGAAGKSPVLILTIALLIAGISLLSLPPVRSFLFGAAEISFPSLCINFGLGYFAVGLIFDAHRVFRKRGA